MHEISWQLLHNFVDMGIMDEISWDDLQAYRSQKGNVMEQAKRDEFIREVTTRLFSSPAPKLALASLFEYFKNIFPLDLLFFATLDTENNAGRTITPVSNNQSYFTGKLAPMDEDSIKYFLNFSKKYHSAYIVNDTIDQRILNKIEPAFHFKDHSDLSLPLYQGSKLLGSLQLRVKGHKKYSSIHIELLNSIHDICTIALSNAIVHEIAFESQSLADNIQLFLRNEQLKKHVAEMVGDSSGLAHVMDMVRRVAPQKTPVLILGETGTGKELIANAIHLHSKVKTGPFIKINCGAIPENLIESELFGHEKGAFTGAAITQKGRFERADGGTIFLDELGELPLTAQVRLLRVLQHQEVERVGGAQPIKINTRVIAATHRNLEKMMLENQFREDLWFRLNVFPIMIPPLRHRKEDIPDLVRFFVDKKSRELNIRLPKDIAASEIRRLLDYEWPGNIRELENLIERELITYKEGPLTFGSLQWRAAPGSRLSQGSDYIFDNLTFDEMASFHISKILEATNGKIEGSGGAAERLDVNANTLRSRMAKYGITHVRKERRGD